MLRSRILGVVLAVALVAIAVNAQEQPKGNLALTARATVSSESEGTKAENLTDGDITNSEWTAKEGTNPAATWVELNWPGVLQIQEILIRQDGDPKLTHVNLQSRAASGEWRLLKSIGDSEHLLPRLILAQFAPQSTAAIRLSDFAGSVSLVEIEAYDRTDPPVIEVASDLLNHIFGIVTDGFGTQPFGNAAVQLQGTAGGKPWHTSTQTDASGMFQVEMPVGLQGDFTATADIHEGISAQCRLHAGDLTPGLSMLDDTVPALDLDGAWRFKPDPESDFFQTNFPDSDWKEIKVPSHWIMEGFDSKNGTGGYRRRLQIPNSFRGRRIKLLFDAVYSGAEVWLNGTRVGSHEGGFSPFEIDITDAAHLGADNLLAVLVREATLSSHLDKMSYYANFPLAGLFRQVRLLSVPEVHVRRFHVQTVFDAAYQDATLALDFSVENESGHELNGVPLVFSLQDPDGHLVAIP
ncbi:MAG: sugar-binding domain-containing protein, partial [Candidatus Acidiferrales bacterium]